MLTIPSDVIKVQEIFVQEMIKKNGSRPLLHFDLVRDALKRDFEASGIDPKGFREVRIAPPASRMVQGDFTPVQVLKVPNVFYHPYFPDTPLWWANTLDGALLRGLGYRNGDRRFLCDVWLNEVNIHGLLAGKSGMGKSVTMNSVMGHLMLMYPPWELSIVISDAKQAEGPRYVEKGPISHIRNLVASEDPGYVVSMLESYVKEMDLINNSLAPVGTDKFSGLREKTNLAIPRTIIDLEEFEMMIENSDKKEKQISKALTGIAKLARSAGVHAFLSSQNISSVNKSTLANMTLRVALGCSPDISEAILGNTAAALNGKDKGKLIVNDDPFTGSESNNVNVRSPWVPPDYFQDLLQVVRDLTEESGFAYKTLQFREKIVLEEKEYREVIELKGTRAPNTIYLGEPSFVDINLDETRQHKVEFKGDGPQNIIILANSDDEHKRLIRLLDFNLNRTKDVSNARSCVFTCDSLLSGEAEIDKTADLYYSIRSSSSFEFRFTVNALIEKSLLINADSKIFDSGYDGSTTLVKDYINKLGPEYKEYEILGNEINQRRAAAIVELCNDPIYKKVFELPINETERANTLMRILDQVMLVGCADGKRVTKTAFKKIYLWFITVNRLAGIGQPSDFHAKNLFTFLLSEASEVNAQVILTSTDTSDLTDFRGFIRYALIDRNVPQTALTGMKFKTFELAECPASLFLWNDKFSSQDEPLKFKKYRIGFETFT